MVGEIAERDLGKPRDEGTQDGQPAKAGIEHANHAETLNKVPCNAMNGTNPHEIRLMSARLLGGFRLRGSAGRGGIGPPAP